MKHFRRVFGILSAVVMLYSVSISVFAINASDIDTSHDGSITIEMLDTAGTKITTGTLTLYQVATLESQSDGNLEYVLTEEFAECDIYSSTTAEIAEELSQWAKEHNITGTSQNISSDGVVAYDELQLGAYLIVQTAESDGFVPINPFMVTVPIEKDGAIIYDIDATPKTTPATVTTSEPVSEPPTVTDKPTVTDEPTVSDNPVVTDEPVVTDNPIVTEQPVVSDQTGDNNPTVSNEPVVSPVVSSDTDNSGKDTGNTTGTDGAKTGDIAMWCAVGVACVAVFFGGVAVMTMNHRKEGEADE